MCGSVGGAVGASSPAAAPPPLARAISASRSVISASEIAPLTRATCRDAAPLTTHHAPRTTHHALLTMALPSHLPQYGARGIEMARAQQPARRLVGGER